MRLGNNSAVAAALGLALLLWLSAVKNDENQFMQSEFFSDLATHPTISLLKSHSTALLGVAGLFFLTTILSAGKLNMRSSILSQIFICLQLYIAVRLAMIDPEDVGKYLTAVLMFIGVCLLFWALQATYGTTATREIICTSLRWFSLALVWMNVLNWIAGYGFVGDSPRLFGTAAHPNFLGVQTGLGSLVALDAVFRRRTARSRVIWLGTLFAALVLLVETGSRTGAVVFIASGAAYLWAWTRFSAALLLLGLALLAFVLLSGVSPDQISASYDRGGINTRDEAWAQLWEQIVQTPIWGEGELRGFSENSFLRGWAAYGMLFPITIMGLMSSALYVFGREITGLGDGKPLCIFFALLVGLAFGAVLEGYLTDVFSPPILIFLLSLTAVPMRSANASRHARRNETDADRYAGKMADRFSADV